MTLHPLAEWEIPEQTATIARASFPLGNIYMKMYEELGVLYTDTEFAELYLGKCGQSAMSPGKLALITVMQFAEGLSDRQAADAVRSRIDWKYALGLELTDPGFDCSVLSEFRSRLCEYELTNKLLDVMLLRFQEKKLIKHRGKQRTDSTQVIEAYQVSLFGPVAIDTSWQAKLKTGFEKSAFVIDWDKQVAICPQGNSNRLWRTARDCNHNPLIEIVFDHKTCAACPVRNLCTSSATTARKIKLRPRDEYQALVERRHQQQTPQFQQNYARRAGVEGTISQAVGRFDLRRTRYFGLAKTHLQHIATACAINLSRFFDWSNHATKARTRTSSFARLRVHCA